MDHEDDDIDFSKLPRGDNLSADEDQKVVDQKDDGEDDDGEAGNDGQPRGKDGKFAKKEPEKSEDDEKDDTEDDEEEEEDEEEEGRKDNLPIRLNKAKQQRDRERAAREEAERRAAELEAQLRQATQKKEPEVDPIQKINDELDELYEQVEELRADAKTKEAAKLQRQIDAKKEEIADIRATRVAQRAATQAQLDAQYDSMVEQIEEAFPVLVKGSDDYDPVQVREFNMLVGAYEKAGLPGPTALRKATQMMFKEDIFGGRKAAPAKKEDEPEKKEPKVEKRKPDAGKAVDTQKRQPPDPSARGVNKDDMSLKPSALSEDEFDALPESKKRALRGDFVK